MRHSYGPPPAEDKLGKPTWPAIKRLIGLASPYKRVLALASLLTLLSTAVQLSFPLLGRAAINEVSASKNISKLDEYVFTFLALITLSAILSFAQFMLGAFAGNRVVMDLRLRLFEHLQRLPITFFDRTRSGDLTSHLSNDVSQLQGTLTDDITKLLAQVVTMIGGVYILLHIDWRLTGIVLTLLLMTMMYFVIFGRRLRKLNREALDALSQVMGSMTEAIANIRLVKAFTRERHEHARASEQMRKVLSLNMKSAVSEGTMGAVGGSGFMLVMLGVIWYGGHRVLNGTLLIGDMVAFFMTLTIIAGPMAQLASLYTRLQRAIGAADRLFAMLDEKPESPDAADAVAFPHGPGAVEFRGVRFCYVPDVPVLQDLDLHLPAGKVTALVGPSGAGKTTIASLLYRFYEPQAGDILIDGVPIRKIRREGLRENIGIVPQEPVLFNGTLRENIRYGRLDATDVEIHQAARDANIEEFVLAMPDRYETLVGERGITLSGGQRQRVAIARALLKDPKVLVLDEATSALDNKSEALVKEALDRLMRGRTTLVIAHRLTTVQTADQIAVIADGQVVETGTHETLLSSQGHYAQLYELVG